MFSTSFRFLYLSFSSVNLFRTPVLTSSHGSAAGKESNHWAAGPLKTEPNNAFLRASYAFCASPCPGLIPNENSIFLSIRLRKSATSSLGSKPVNFPEKCLGMLRC